MARKALIDMTGLRYGRLVGLSLSHLGPSGHAHWHFACDCGARIIVDGSKVRSGNTTSCGCRHREISAARLTVHGHRAEKRHGMTYRAWQAMKDSCYNAASPKFGMVGACGIEVCPMWIADYERFRIDMGERPNGTTLERLDGARDFAPDNCAWVLTPSRSVRACKGWEKRRSTPLARPIADRPVPRPSTRRPNVEAPSPPEGSSPSGRSDQALAHAVADTRQL